MLSSEQKNFPQPITYSPSLSEQAAGQALSRLVVSGAIRDDDLQSRIARLSRSFRAYAAGTPVPCWASGLVITDEMRTITNSYIPFEEVRTAIFRFCRVALRGEHPTPPLMDGTDSWLDLLTLLPADISSVDPSSMLSKFLNDWEARERFLFSLYLPARYGGAFGRYPHQAAFLRTWITGSKKKGGPVSILDAACGSGEGVYELASLCREAGIAPAETRITGVTVSPLEIYSAAYARFPHAGDRETGFRRFVQPLHESGTVAGIRFVAADINGWRSQERYRIIVCNGLLGGPMMHDRDKVESCVKELTAHLLPGGILLAANRFHGGWQKMFPVIEMEKVFQCCGLTLLQSGEGICGILR